MRCLNISHDDLVLKAQALRYLLRDPRHHHVELHVSHIHLLVELLWKFCALHELLHLCEESKLRNGMRAQEAGAHTLSPKRASCSALTPRNKFPADMPPRHAGQARLLFYVFYT